MVEQPDAIWKVGWFDSDPPVHKKIQQRPDRGVAFLLQRNPKKSYGGVGNMPMGGIGNLFMGALAADDKVYLKPLLQNARKQGYTRFVEPCAGALDLSYLAVECGFDPKQIEASDVSYFSGVMGRAVSGRPLDDMEIQAEGFTAEELSDPATALYAQLYLRTVSTAGREYYLEILKDLRFRRKSCIEDIQKRIDLAKAKCGGMSYRDMDMWAYLEEVMDDENAVVVMWPPTYTAGYEKFFDTQGRLKWHEPSYRIFDPEDGIYELYEAVKNAKALVLIGQERAAGDCVGEPIYGRDSGRVGVYRYMTANRPEEAVALAQGKDIDRKNGGKMTPLKKPILPADYIVTKKSQVDVIPIKAENATYYRRLWTHNFVGGSGGSAMAVIIDGYVAGVFGYDKFTCSLSGGSDLLIKFSMTAPCKQRINRLLYMLASNKEIAHTVLNDIQKESVRGVFTVMITKYAENKEVRGLMKLTAKKPEGRTGYKLTYRCDMQDRTKEETFKLWMQKEEQWQKSRSNSKAKV